MSYLIVILFFFVISVTQHYINKANEDNVKKVLRSKERVSPIIDKYEKKLELESIGPNHLRSVNIYQNLKEKDREPYRQEMIEQIEMEDGDPFKNIKITVGFLFVRVVLIYLIYLAAYEPKIYWISLALMISTIVSWVIRKKVFYTILFTVIGFLIYFKLPSTIALFLLLASLERIIKTVRSGIKGTEKREGDGVSNGQ